MRTRFAGRTTVRVTRKPYAPTVIRVDTFGIGFSLCVDATGTEGQDRLRATQERASLCDGSLVLGTTALQRIENVHD